MQEAGRILNILGILLSFANGGELYPLCIVGSAASFHGYHNQSLENLGGTWLVNESDLANYLQCYTTFEKMLGSKNWGIDNRLLIILVNYFQALQKTHWPIKVSALGMILEYLIPIISQELKDLKQIETWGNRGIKGLLNYMGIQITEYEKKAFWYIRDRAAHRCTYKWKLKGYPDPYENQKEINQIFLRAIQWVEEILLWRLGYNGKYHNRDSWPYSSRSPRYDLSTRPSEWDEPINT